MKRLTIIGVSHYKEGLFDELIDFYNKINPDAIGLEYSSPEDILGHYHHLKKQKLINSFFGLDSRLKTGGEVYSAVNYS